MPEFHAVVAETLATPDSARFTTAPVAALTVDLRGIPGDRHYGFTRPAGARERWYPQGMEMRSGRQISIVAAEELAIVAARMDVPRIEPGWIGANVLVRSVPDFSSLPWGTRLFFEGGAVLVNEGENAPCRFAGAGIAAHYPERSGLDLLFPRVAKNLRGIVASVERAGGIAPGPVRLKIPVQKQWPGGPTP
jgi:hypothetical protein